MFTVLKKGAALTLLGVLTGVGTLAMAESVPSKPATEATKAANAQVLKSLPFSDKGDFGDAQRGFIGKPEVLTIKDASGRVVWDLESFKQFIGLDKAAPETVNPSLWRMAQLNMQYGLFKVTERIYQVRGYDLSNISFIQGDIDGVKRVFQMTPGTEAPAEMNTLFPQFKTLWMAENTTNTLHNILTLRGDQVRDALRWAKFIDETIELYGADVEVKFQSHHWPVWGQAKIVDYLKRQRELYKYLHDQSVRLMNQGYIGSEIAELLLADTYEQLAYQAESGPWPSVCLEGAHELRNGVPEADVSLTLAKTSLDDMQLGVATLEQQITDGRIKLEGRKEAFSEFMGLLDSFPFWFHIVTP